MSYRSSFSQHNLFLTCPRTWYYSKILKVPYVSDFCYANAGTAVHKSLEKYYTTNNANDAKEEFNSVWDKYRLDDSKIKHQKDTYWVMCLNGMNLELPITSTELKIYYPDAIAYIDAVITTDDSIIDWKSSKRTEDNEEEYKQQLKLYAWMYYRKFGRIPKKATVYYLRYSGTRGELSFNFTEEDVKDAETWYYTALEKMEYYIENPKEIPQWNFEYFWCPYKSLWDTTGGDALKFVMHLYGNELVLEGPITPLLQKGIETKFSYELKDAHWIKKARPHANTTVRFYNSRKQSLPLGFKEGVTKTLSDYAAHKKVGLDLTVTDHRVFDDTVVPMPEKFINGITLRDYQEKAVTIFSSKKIGILEVGTGGGKTEIAIELIRQLGQRTLFIVDKIELLRQTKKRLEDALGIPIGQVGSGVNDIQEVTVATIQTLNKNIKEYTNYLKTIRFVVFDETHKVAAKSYVKVSRYLSGTEYRMGLSGTAFRDDGNDMMINAVTGNIIHNLSSKVLIEKGWLVRPTINFIKDYMTKEETDALEEECKVGLINETADYAPYYLKFIAENEIRNQRVYDLAKENTDKKILILTKLIEHGKVLQENIPNSQHLYGGTNKKEREEMFKKFVEGESNVLVSTISIFAEGIDIPALDVVINASANRGDVKTIQVLGRVLRKLDGKKEGIYYDFFDATKFFRVASIARKKTLLNQGHNINMIH